MERHKDPGLQLAGKPEPQPSFHIPDSNLQPKSLLRKKSQNQARSNGLIINHQAEEGAAIQTQPARVHLKVSPALFVSVDENAFLFLGNIRWERTEGDASEDRGSFYKRLNAEALEKVIVRALCLSGNYFHSQ